MRRVLGTHHLRPLVHCLIPSPTPPLPPLPRPMADSLLKSFSSLSVSDSSRGGARDSRPRRGRGGGGSDRIDALGRPMADSLLKPFSSLSVSDSSRGGARDSRPRRGGRGGGGSDRIDALGRLLTRILRHMAPELRLDIRSDGYVKVKDLLALNMSTYAKVPLREHSLDDVREAVRKDNKQRFSLLEENGELLIRANQGHTIRTISSESLLKPISSSHEVPVCVHGTYKKNLESILKSGLKRMTRLHIHFACGLPGEVISGIRHNVDILIFLNVEKALQEGMKLYISDNKVILTEGFDGVVPVKYFEKIETWPGREAIPFSN